MRRLLSVLTLYQSNVKILHWKLTTTDFDTVHSLMSEYEEKLGEFIDDIAEIGLQIETNPVNIVEAINLLNGDEAQYMSISGYEDFTPKTCFEKIDFMFSNLLSLYESHYNDESLAPDIVNVLQEHAYWLRKELRYKNKRRLMNN